MMALVQGPWRPEEDQALKVLLKHMTIIEIGCALHRPYRAIRYRMHKLGLRKRKQCNWTTLQEERAMQMWLEGKSYLEIAQEFGVTSESARRKVYELRQREKAS